MDKFKKLLYYGLGSILLMLGLGISAFWWHLYQNIVISKVLLTNDSSSVTYQSWSDPNIIPLYFEIYMFNWTNAEASVRNGEKPHLQETGPYVYRLRQFKEHIAWNSNDTITYFNRQLWNFVPEFSKGRETDIVTGPNVVLMSILQTLSELPEVEKFRVILDLFFKYNKIKIYTTKSVKQLLFDGYDDKLLDFIKLIKKVKPRIVIPEKFGWYLPKNESIPEIYNIYTGHSDQEKFGIVHTWNYSTHRPSFEGSCGDVNGSTGDFWPINVASQQNASLYISDFCSSFLLEKVGASSVYGIDGITFEGRLAMFDNGTNYPELKCYCPHSTCHIKSGVRNLTSCVNAPVYLSYPHFYLADNDYKNAVQGMHSDARKHRFFLTVQKNFGLVLQGAARLQLNVRIEPKCNLSLFGKVTDVIVPALWFEEKINLPQNVASKLYTFFSFIPLMLTIVGFVLVILGSVLLVVGLLMSRSRWLSIPYVQEDL